MNTRGKDKILILSASFGDGHKQVANAISEAADIALSDAEPIVIDIMQWLHPYLFPVSHFVYKKVINNFPKAYSYLYQKTREKSSFSMKLNKFFSAGMHSMLEFLNQIQPKVVVSTYPFAASIMSKLKENGLVDIPTVTIITDYTDHSYWLHPYTDQYLVGSEQVKDRLVFLGVEPAKIKCTGIPIRKQFLQNHSREEAASKFGLDSTRFTILVMGGGEGLIGKGKSTFQAFENLSTSVQFIIVCGRNKKLHKHLSEELINSKHKVLLLGYCENIHELMAVADIMISKPGGVTTSEAMAMELPLLLYNPLPGQEEDNASYLVASGLAVLARDQEDLLQKTQQMIQNSYPLLYIKSRLKLFQSRTSSFDALNIIVRLAGQNQLENQVVNF